MIKFKFIDMRRFLLILMSLILVCSCVDDEGNYDYKKINEVTIRELTAEGDTVDGIRNWSMVSEVDTLTYRLDIEGSLAGDDMSGYEFEWYIRHDGNYQEHTTIGNEKDLVYPVTVSPGRYNVYFQVTDRNTGLKWLEGATLTVTSPMTRGFLILGDTDDGTVGVDMLAMPANKDTIMMEGVFDNSEYGFKGAEKLLFAGSRAGAENDKQALWMTTADNSYRLTNQDSIAYMGDAENFGMIETVYPHKTPMRILDMFPRQSTMNRSATYRGYITEDMAFFNGIPRLEYLTVPVNRYDASSENFFRPYPLAFCKGINMMAYNCILLYDMDYDAFVKINSAYSATHCVNPTNEYPNDRFPWNQHTWQRDKPEGYRRTIVYGENAYDGSDGSSYAIMKEVEGFDDEYFIYQFTVDASPISPYNVTKGECYTIDKGMAAGFEKASLYAFASNQTRLMYAVGSTLYMYDYARKQLTEKDFGDEITYLESEFCSAGEKNAFLMATYNAAGKKGTIRKLTVGNDPNKCEIIDRPDEVWETRLRVKDMEWKNTNM